MFRFLGIPPFFEEGSLSQLKRLTLLTQTGRPKAANFRHLVRRLIFTSSELLGLLFRRDPVYRLI